jgi:hypothetical protein
VLEMRRREFITLLGGTAAAWPLAARAQPGERMRRIGVLLPAAADDPVFQARLAAFYQGLAHHELKEASTCRTTK